ncbi:hypothetical protein HHI36_003149 [Cryptolaemus montrouzieri]|uniref:Uncharacterized protein n=1 Tax=Cryptolaemus montrouzieri TaxID=559131 RepID=A0ABD2PD25_9CUCU
MNTEETDQEEDDYSSEEDDYSSEEDDEPASQGKNGKGKERLRNGNFVNEQVTNDSADIEDIDVTSPVELLELFVRR